MKPFQVVYPSSRVVRKLYRKEEIKCEGMVKPGSFTTLPDGEEEVFYATEISMQGLDSMAKRAANNKSGKCVDGPLRVRVLGRRKL